MHQRVLPIAVAVVVGVILSRLLPDSVLMLVGILATVLGILLAAAIAIGKIRGNLFHHEVYWTTASSFLIGAVALVLVAATN